MKDFNSVCKLTIQDLGFQCIAKMIICDTQLFTENYIKNVSNKVLNCLVKFGSKHLFLY